MPKKESISPNHKRFKTENIDESTDELKTPTKQNRFVLKRNSPNVKIESTADEAPGKT